MVLSTPRRSTAHLRDAQPHAATSRENRQYRRASKGRYDRTTADLDRDSGDSYSRPAFSGIYPAWTQRYEPRPGPVWIFVLALGERAGGQRAATRRESGDRGAARRVARRDDTGHRLGPVLVWAGCAGARAVDCQIVRRGARGGLFVRK